MGFSLLTAVTETANIKHNGNKVFAGFITSQLSHHEGKQSGNGTLLSNRHETLTGLQDLV